MRTIIGLVASLCLAMLPPFCEPSAPETDTPADSATVTPADPEAQNTEPPTAPPPDPIQPTPPAEPRPVSPDEPPRPAQPEPNLISYACGVFPTLPLPATTREERTLEPDASAYVWMHHWCDWPYYPEGEDPFGPPDPEAIFVYLDSTLSDGYLGLMKFETPPVSSAATVELQLFCNYVNPYIGFSAPGFRVDFLQEAWAWPRVDPTTWRVWCEEELPAVNYFADYMFSVHPVVGEWYSLDITDLYNAWSSEQVPNYGLMIQQESWYNGASFHSGRYTADLSLRPKLVITTPPNPTLAFPLSGRYSGARINDGGDFGEWWKSMRCDNSDIASPKLRHSGVDLQAAVDDVVYAVQDGVIKYANTDKENVGYVVVEHNGKWTSTYTHVIPTNPALTDDTATRVRRGDPIARVGYLANGGTHLHFQVRFAPFELPWSLRGRLPDQECHVGSTDLTEPAFPEKFVDPKCLNWE